ncbi:protein fem-1 homolog A-like isoform X2 [Macrobrachium rosenbergii]|uniref:protein fem-1 homolog A-like isoform X2 n=1 Tax=Macrobrachium rosenbergii TaxID=79674 RepID=UPI0034D43B48
MIVPLLIQILQGRSGHAVASCLDNMGVAFGPYLVKAARMGHMHCVKFIVEVFRAPLEEDGLVSAYHVYEAGATPLWAATVGGHYDVAEYLVSKGADVNAATRSNSSPLSVACSHVRLDLIRLLVEHGANIERTDDLGITCLMLACHNGNPEVVRYLVEIGADVNRQRIDGRTALHECANNGHLEAAKLLLDHYACISPDSMGETPLLRASLKGHAHIVEHMISRRELVPVQDWIEAIELLGATFADKKRDVASAIAYWEMAMNERRANDIPVRTEADDPLFSEHFQELRTPEQLEEIRSRRDAIGIQSMLVRARVLGYGHHATFTDVRRKGAKLATAGDVKRCIVLWARGLEMQQRTLGALDLRRLFFLTSLTDLFSYMVLMRPELYDNAAYFEDVLRLFESCRREVEMSVTHKIHFASHIYFHYLDCLIPLAIHLMLILLKLKPLISSPQLVSVKKAVYRLVKLDPRDITGSTLLHRLCAGGSIVRAGSPVVSTFPSSEIVNVLLETGADPCATDHYGNTPLHALASNGECPREILNALLSAGGHLDAVNKNGFSFGSLRASQGERLHQIVNPVRHTSLQCLAAAALRKHGIAYKGVVHPQLERFVDMH